MWSIVFVAALAVMGLGAALAQPASCTKTDFEAVVDQASAALQGLNQTNKPAFQDKLRQLREKRGWSHDQFLREAVPFVQDENIAEFDQKSADFLDKINAMGQDGGAARAPDCNLLHDLRATMQALVDAQTAKWTYMFEKLERELGK